MIESGRAGPRGRSPGTLALCAALVALLASPPGYAQAPPSSTPPSGPAKQGPETTPPPSDPAEPAEDPALPPPPAPPVPPGLSPHAAPPLPRPEVAPALSLDSAAEPPTPVTQKWWFWATVGAVVAGTVTVFLLTTSGNTPPGTRLGNMEAFD